MLSLKSLETLTKFKKNWLVLELSSSVFSALAERRKDIFLNKNNFFYMFATNVSLVMRKKKKKVCSSPLLRFITLYSLKFSNKKKYASISWDVAAAGQKSVV